MQKPLSRPPARQLLQVRETPLQTILVLVLGPHRCSRYPQRRGAVPIPRGLLGPQPPCRHQSHPPASLSPPLSQSFRTASEQGPSVPMGARSLEYDTATSYYNSTKGSHLSQGQILEACPDQAFSPPAKVKLTAGSADSNQGGAVFWERQSITYCTIM